MKRALALAFVCLWSASAYGDFVGPLVRIEVENDDGSGVIEFPVPLVDLPSQALERIEWMIQNSHSIFSANNPGNALAVLEGLAVTLDGDPAVSLNFSLTSGGSDTTVTITSATVFFAPIVNPEAYAVAGVTLTDNNSNGATATGLQPGVKLYEATYNTSVGWADLVGSLSALVDNTAIGNERMPLLGRQVIPATVSSIQSEFKFILSAGDSISATSRFYVIPEPATMSLLGIGALALLRRRRN